MSLCVKKSKISMVVLSLLLLISSLFGNSSAVYAESGLTFTTEQWNAVEITFASSIAYSNPYVDVDIDAVFTGPEGQKLTMPGFWDGGDVWKIRFAPPSVGRWSYTTICTDQSNTGLNNQTGVIECTPYIGEQDMYKHGFLTKSADNRYLTYNDGTPFFYLADTHWMGLSYRERLYESNDARFQSEFRGMVDTRAAQGYNVYKMNFFIGEDGDISPNGTYNEGGHPWDNSTNYKITASSTLKYDGPDGYHYDASRAIDGNEETFWKAANNTYPQWLRVDLGEVKNLSKINTIFGNDDTWSYIIEASMDGTNYSLIVDKSTGTSGKIFVDDTNIQARYIRVTVTGNSSGKPVSINEFTAYDTNGNDLNNKCLFTELNPGFWQNCDQRIKYVVDKGIIPELGIDWGRHILEGNTNQYKKVARYIVARYGAYSTIWDIAGEFATGPVDPWKEVAAYTRAVDPYARLLTLNNHVNNPDLFRNESWYDFVNLQGGHGSLKNGENYWLRKYNLLPTKPILEGESNYENIHDIPSYYTREVAWNSVIYGSCGYGYGAEGIWQATWNSNDSWQVGGAVAVPWYSALDKPAGMQMQYLKDFFISLDWTSLVPKEDTITWSDSAPYGMQAPFQKANMDNTTIVAYLPKDAANYTGVVNNLSHNETYTAWWFNTQTGEYTVIDNDFTPDSEGHWFIPQKPDTTDWTLLIRKTANMTAQPIINLASGTYESEQSVSINCSTQGATVYYTLDGSTPTKDSHVYTAPITLDSSCTLKAVAIKDESTSMICTQYYKFGSIPATGITLSKTSLNMNWGESYLLKASLTPLTATDTAINWSTSNKSIAVVDSTGLVTAVGAGSVIVTGTLANGASASCTIQIMPKNEILVSMGKGATSSTSNDSLHDATKAVDGNPATYWCATGNTRGGTNPQWIEVDLGDVYDLSRVEQNFKTTGDTWYYKIEGSTDGSEYTILADKTAQGVKSAVLSENVSGKARFVKLTITNDNNGNWVTSTEFKVYAKAPDVLLSQGKGATSSTSNDSLHTAAKAVDGDTSTFWCATGNTSGGTKPQWIEVDLGDIYDITRVEQNFKTTGDTWYYKIEGSTDGSEYAILADKTTQGVKSAVLSENVSGKARFIKLTITNDNNGNWVTSTEFKVFGIDNTGTDSDTVTGVSFNKTGLSLTTGGTGTLSATIKPNKDINKTLTWRSSDENIATVGSNGNVTAVAPGSATITLTVDGGFIASCLVNVTNPGLLLDKVRFNMYPGETEAILATLDAANADKPVAWSSNNPAVAMVNENGAVTAVAEGKAQIKAETQDGLTAVSDVTVVPAASGMKNLALTAIASASSTANNAAYSPANIIDGNKDTATWVSWSAELTDTTPVWVQLNFGKPAVFNRVDIYSKMNYEQSEYEVQYWNGSQWVNCFNKITRNTKDYRTHTFPTVTSTKLRVYMTTGNVQQHGQLKDDGTTEENVARLSEVEVYCEPKLNAATLTASDYSIKKLSTSQLSVSGTLATGDAAVLTNAAITYLSSDSTVASVDLNGVVTGIKSGSTDITAYVHLDGTTVASNKITITVTEDTIPEGTASSSESVPLLPSDSITENNGIAVVKLVPQLEDRSIAKTVFSEETMKKALELSKSGHEGMKKVVLDISNINGADTFKLVLPSSLLSAERNDKQLVINTPMGTMTLPGNMFSYSELKDEKNLEITIGKSERHPIDKKLQEKIGDRPVIDIHVRVGGSTIDWNNPDVPVTVSIDYKPTEEELKETGHIVVWYIDEQGKAVAVPNGKYDSKTGKVTFVTTHFSSFAIAGVYKTFSDTASYSWARTQIEVLASKEIMSGDSEDIFSPGRKVTRSEFITSLVKTLGLSSKVDSNFSDMGKTDVNYTYIGIAKALGITKGIGNNSFHPDALISRQDAMVLTYKALESAGRINSEAATETNLSKFRDSSEISAYAEESISVLVSKGLISGSGNKLNPTGDLTKAETACILSALLKL